MPEQSNDYRVVVFGAGGVGKSSLVLRFVKGTFRESYIPTIEDTYRQVNCRKSVSQNDVMFKLHYSYTISAIVRTMSYKARLGLNVILLLSFFNVNHQFTRDVFNDNERRSNCSSKNAGTFLFQLGIQLLKLKNA